MFSARELQVLSEVARGKSNQEIGKILGLSPLTIKSHVRRIFKKTGTSDRQNLVSWGYRQGYLQRLRKEEREITEPLTDRERECVVLVIFGLSNKQIAKRIFLSEDTVKTHLRKAFKKTGAMSRAHIITLAWQHELISHETWELGAQV